MPRPTVPSTSVRRPSAAPGRPGPVRSAVALLAVVATTVLTTACSGDDASQPSTTTQPATTTTGAPDTTTTTTEPTTTTAAPTPEEEVKTAYLEASAAYFQATASPNPDDPVLGNTRAGPSLKRTQDILADLRKDGVRVVFANDQHPVPSITDVELIGIDRAFVTVCLVDNAQQVRISDGVVVDDDVLSRLDKADMRRSGGRWRLYDLEALQRWRDGEGCDR